MFTTGTMKNFFILPKTYSIKVGQDLGGGNLKRDYRSVTTLTSGPGKKMGGKHLHFFLDVKKRGILVGCK